MVSPSDVWAVGVSGTILHYDGTSWNVYGSPVTYAGSPVNLYSVFMVSSDEGWAVGITGTSGVIARYASGSWAAYQSRQGPQAL